MEHKTAAVIPNKPLATSTSTRVKPCLGFRRGLIDIILNSILRDVRDVGSQMRDPSGLPVERELQLAQVGGVTGGKGKRSDLHCAAVNGTLRRVGRGRVIIVSECGRDKPVGTHLIPTAQADGF